LGGSVVGTDSGGGGEEEGVPEDAGEGDGEGRVLLGSEHGRQSREL